VPVPLIHRGSTRNSGGRHLPGKCVWLETSGAKDRLCTLVPCSIVRHSLGPISGFSAPEIYEKGLEPFGQWEPGSGAIRSLELPSSNALEFARRKKEVNPGTAGKHDCRLHFNPIHSRSREQMQVSIVTVPDLASVKRKRPILTAF